MVGMLSNCRFPLGRLFLVLALLATSLAGVE